MQQKDCGDLADFIAANISLDFEQKQCILDELHPEKRIAKLNDILSDEIKVMSLEHEISQKAQEQMDENQRVYMLREQMRAIASPSSAKRTTRRRNPTSSARRSKS